MAKETGHEEKEYAEYVYSSSELSRFYGITIKGMEFYESRGLVKPERTSQGKVRRYSLPDSYRLYFTRLYKNLGFGISQTADLLQNSTMDHLDAVLGAHMEGMRRELFLRQRMLEETERTQDLLRASGGEPFFEVTEEEGFCRLFLRRFHGPHRSSREETEEYKAWNDCLPVTNASLLFPLPDCESEEGEADTEIGLIVRMKDFDALGFRESGRTWRIPPGRFLHTLLTGDALDLCGKERIRPALRALAERGLAQTGDAFTRMIMVYRKDGRELRCDEAWFPVK